MGHKLLPEHQELYRRVDEVLHYLWDPIGISSHPEARDEYHSYLPTVFSLLINGGTTHDIVSFLTMTATQTMGLSNTQSGREHSHEIATILKNWRDVIHEHHASHPSPN